ncbi:MAG: heme exporter protein CcmB [Anaerolineae bacterium]
MLEAQTSDLAEALRERVIPSRWRESLAQYLGIVAAIVWKDLRSEARGRDIFSLWVAFGLLILFVFSTTIDTTALPFEAIGPGFLWVSFALVGTIGLNQSFSQERDRGGWEALLMAPADHSAIYFGKLISNLVFTLVAEIAVLVGFTIFSRLSADPFGLLFATFLGTLGFVGVGTLLAAFVANTRAKELLLPVMLLPVIVPVIALASQLTAGALAGTTADTSAIVAVFLIGYDAIAILGGAAAFSFITELH